MPVFILAIGLSRFETSLTIQMHDEYASGNFKATLIILSHPGAMHYNIVMPMSCQCSLDALLTAPFLSSNEY